MLKGLPAFRLYWNLLSLRQLAVELDYDLAPIQRSGIQFRGVEDKHKDGRKLSILSQSVKPV